MQALPTQADITPDPEGSRKAASAIWTGCGLRPAWHSRAGPDAQPLLAPVAAGMKAGDAAGQPCAPVAASKPHLRDCAGVSCSPSAGAALQAPGWSIFTDHFIVVQAQISGHDRGSLAESGLIQAAQL